MYSVLCCVPLCMAVLAISSSAKAQQDCLMATNGQRPLPNLVRPGGSAVPRFREQPIQAIITSYRFNCCGVVTEWRAIVERSGGGHFVNQPYSGSFQVWRPNSSSPVDTDGCYTMVGVNTFSPIPLADPDINQGLLTGIPLLNDRIEVQPGDVIGFYLESSRGNDDGIQFARPDFLSEAVWYSTGTIPTDRAGPCPFPVGPDRILSSSTNRAPLIRATVSTSPCPMPTSIPSRHSSQSTLPIAPSTSSHQPLTPTFQPTPTPMDTTTSRPVGTADNVGLYLGIVVSIVVVGVILVGVVILCCVVTKKDKRSKAATSSSPLTTNNLLSRHETVTETALTTQTNEAYGEITDPVYSYIDPPIIPLAPSQAYGDTYTRGNTDYYVNEELGGAAELRINRNKAYDVSRRAHSDNEPSIPTTENDAYTSGSANTERIMPAWCD